MKYTIKTQKRYNELYYNCQLPNHLTFNCNKISLHIEPYDTYKLNQWDFSRCRELLIYAKYGLLNNETCIPAKIKLIECTAFDVSYEIGEYDITEMSKCNRCRIAGNDINIVEDCEHCIIDGDTIAKVVNCTSSDISIIECYEPVLLKDCTNCNFTFYTNGNTLFTPDIKNCKNCTYTYL